MKKLLLKFLSFFFPKSLLVGLNHAKFAGHHPFPPATLIKRKKADIHYEVEFIWYDYNFVPITVVRDVHSRKIYSFTILDFEDFEEVSTKDRSAGSTV